MKRPVRSRRWIAWCAAYVVALQALLLPLSVAASSPLAGAPCVSDSTGNVPTPPGHDAGCPCAAGCGMACAIHALLAPPQASLVVARTFLRVEMRPLKGVSVTGPTARTPQNPRAPPAV